MKKKIISILLIFIVALIGYFSITYKPFDYSSKFALSSERTLAVSDNEIVDTLKDEKDILFNDITNVSKIRSNGFFAVVSKSGKVYTNSSFDDELSNWEDIKDVAVGYMHIVGLKEDGTLVAKGENKVGQCNVQKFKDVKEVKAGAYHTVCLSEKGKIFNVGRNSEGQRDFKGWEDIVSIECGPYSTYGIKKDGSILTTEKSKKYDFSQFKNIKKLSVSLKHVVGVKKDGTVVATGDNTYGQCDLKDLKNVASVKAGTNHTIVVFKDGSMKGFGKNDRGQTEVEKWNIKM